LGMVENERRHELRHDTMCEWVSEVVGELSEAFHGWGKGGGTDGRLVSGIC
jgi:hypothetical protein